MILSSRTAAGRSRSADEGAFLRSNVVHTTGSDPSVHPASSPHAWKRTLQERVWSPQGPKGLAARSVLMLLIWHADTNGRTWLGIQSIASKTGAGNLRTVRNALDVLIRGGWLQSTPQTWASLTTEQAAAGRPVPRRGDVGQAPNLYVVLDGSGNTLTSDVPHTPGQIGQGGPSQNSRGGPLADLLCDLDPKGSPSKIKSDERATRDVRRTHLSSKIHDESTRRLEAWNVIVETHSDQTKKVYGLPPLAPDLKREQQKALAECLNGAVLDVQAKLRARTSVESDVAEVRRELATRVMQLYFKRDNEHLRRVKHALRDLPREFHARVTEAMQSILRESHDATHMRVVQAERPDKPTRVDKPRPVKVASQSQAAQAITAQEARRLVEALSASSTSKQSRANFDSPMQPVKATQREEFGTKRERSDKPAPDKPSSSVHHPARSGAPRWGTVGLRPIKVRKVWAPHDDAYDAVDKPDESPKSKVS